MKIKIFFLMVIFSLFSCVKEVKSNENKMYQKNQETDSIIPSINQWSR